MSKRLRAALATAAFLCVAPGSAAGLVPWLLSHWRMAPPFFGVASMRWLGGALIVAGIPALLEPFARFAHEGSGTPAPIYPTDRLIVTGLYRYVRNPMYLGIVAIVLGQGLLLSRGGVLVYGVLLWLGFHMFVLIYEEPTLARHYGAQFATYCAGVRRWLPRFTPWRDLG